jgi:hypothetical protein
MREADARNIINKKSYIIHSFNYLFNLTKPLTMADHYNQQEKQNCAGWLKMVHPEIVATREEDLASNKAASTKGIIQDIINEFKTSLPWLSQHVY